MWSIVELDARKREAPVPVATARQSRPKPLSFGLAGRAARMADTVCRS